METKVASAPGKISLAGEHAVVYGYPAIVAAIDRRLTVTACRGKTGKPASGLVKFALSQILKPGEIVDLKIDSEIPINSGLGSSAALATALVWALRSKAPLEEKNRLVKIIEDYQHGKSSGVDQTIVREGGCLRFQKREFEPVSLGLKQAVLIDSGKPKESTGDMVKKVARSNFSKQFKQIGKLVGQWRPELIKENEQLLESIGVVGKKAQTMVRLIEKSGGVAKICGAGGVRDGSGMLLAYHRDHQKLLRLIKRSSWHYLKVNLGEPGVRDEAD